jgi:hypothetical protein
VQAGQWLKNFGTILDLCVSSLRREHANLLCIVHSIIRCAEARAQQCAEDLYIPYPTPHLMYVRDALDQGEHGKDGNSEDAQHMNWDSQDPTAVRRSVLSSPATDLRHATEQQGAPSEMPHLREWAA